MSFSIFHPPYIPIRYHVFFDMSIKILSILENTIDILRKTDYNLDILRNLEKR